jgi:membrane protease YdiL (CAAX protease family)
MAWVCLLGAPGLEAYAAAAAVVSGHHAAIPAASRVATPLAAPSNRSKNRLSSLLPGTFNPGLSAQSLLPAVDATRNLYAPISPAGLPDIARPEMPSLENISNGIADIEFSRKTDASPEADRKVLDRIFEARVRSVASEAASAQTLESGPTGLAKSAVSKAASPRGPPAAKAAAASQPRQSLARSVYVGWFAGLGPVVFSIVVTLAAEIFGYQMHPSYPGLQSLSSPIAITAAASEAVAVAVIAPIAEELIFRKGLMGGLRRILNRIPKVGDFWLPAIISSTVFVMKHETSDPLLIFTRMIYALILSRTYQKEGLAASIFSHAFFNGVIIAPFLLSALGIGPIVPLVMGSALTAISWRELRAQKAERASGRLVPYEINGLQLLALGAVLIIGYIFLSPVSVWITAACGYAVWFVYGLVRKKGRTNPVT